MMSVAFLGEILSKESLYSIGVDINIKFVQTHVIDLFILSWGFLFQPNIVFDSIKNLEFCKKYKILKWIPKVLLTNSSPQNVNSIYLYFLYKFLSSAGKNSKL